MAITGVQRPDFRTVNEFRRRHLQALRGLFLQVLRGLFLQVLRGLFLQVLQLCRKAGLCKLGHVALDGTKIKANASKHSAMSYGRMKEKIPELQKEISEWFKQAELEDQAEDKQHGADKRGDELPDWVMNKQLRMQKMKDAKAALEAEQRAKDGPDDDPEPPRGGGGKRKRGKRKRGKRKRGKRKRGKRKRGKGEPEDRAQYNFTDPESRIMKGADGFVQGYNAQAAVDADNQIIVAHGLTTSAADNQIIVAHGLTTSAADNQIIVAHGLTTSAADSGQLLPMVDEIRANLGRHADEISADKGYISEDNLRGLKRKRLRAYIATGRQRHDKAAATSKTSKPLTRAMGKRLRQGGWRSRYRLRKQTVEPVFGQVKHARGFRMFSLRGESKVSAEWAMVCTAHNLCKLAAASR
jgi:hypothetical protein